MALQKQNIPINFSLGLNQKTDPKQLAIGNFQAMDNSVFDKTGLLKKANGYPRLPDLPDDSYTLITTFKGNLTAIGENIAAYSSPSKTWVNRGNLQPITLSTISTVRSNLNSSNCDSVTAANGFVCTTFTETQAGGGFLYKYTIQDSTTGQVIVSPTAIPVSSGIVTYSPKVFLLGQYFVIVFTNVITATDHLQYIAIRTADPTTVFKANTDISTTYTRNSSYAWDGIVSNNVLYVGWNGSDGGGAIRMTYIDQTLTQHSTVVYAGKTAAIMSLCADETGTTSVIYNSFYDAPGTTGYTLAVNFQLTPVLAPTAIAPTTAINTLTSTAQNGVCKLFLDIHTTYSYGSNTTDFIRTRTVTSAGVVSAESVLIRSLTLASRAFLLDGISYFLTLYDTGYQPTYFLVSSLGKIVAKMAYQNGGLPSFLLSNVTLSGTTAQISFLYKDLIEAVNKNQFIISGQVTAGVYSQTGVNLATFEFTTSESNTAEIANDLHISGGFLWMYDGSQAVEHGFHLYPDNVTATWAATGGAMHAQPDGATNTNAYFYQVLYEWSDNQGNIHRSAPSIPIPVTTTGSGVIGSVVLNINTLRATAKITNPVKIVIYRWSVAQQTYYQVTSATLPTLNSTTVDSVSFTDTLADSSVLGASILYTTGGVVENIGAPACTALALYRSRLLLIDAEDENLLWFSKQVIESTPVEMSDLFTIYVAPTTSAQNSTGGLKALSAMDDKAILFKKDAIYYFTGIGPDNTGANNDFSDPVFVTSTVGCSNQKSIVFIPNGLMFESDKGIWLLGRDLSTVYIGSPVEDYTRAGRVQSAVSIPGTNQVRFTLSTGVTLQYDYFYGQWNVRKISAVSSTLFEDEHTLINRYGQVYQEEPGTYLDGSSPVLMNIKTGWISLTGTTASGQPINGLQGFERAYSFYFIGTYKSPHKLQVQIAYDYNDSPAQSLIISPDNYSGVYGSGSYYGDSVAFGGPINLERWRIFFDRQKCQAFQITLTEVFDPSFGTIAGEGLNISGLNLTVGIKGNYPRLPAARSAG